MNRTAVFLASMLLIAGIAGSQEQYHHEKIQSFSFTQDEPVRIIAPLLQNERDRTNVAFYLTEMAAGGEVVTNAPYTATAVEETTQVLGDGNRIVNKSSDLLARDSQGRTRRETTLNRVGTVPMESSKLIFISDPTTHTQYILHGSEATKIVKPGAGWNIGPTIGDEHMRTVIRQKIDVTRKRTVEKQEGGADSKHEGPTEQVKHENLGTQTIEGVSAEGKRETTTIPAGQLGNERPIEVVSETWYSPELHTMVLRKHSDPHVGETVYRLTEIRRIEPDPALFQPPAGAKTRVEPLIELKQRQNLTPKE